MGQPDPAELTGRTTPGWSFAVPDWETRIAAGLSLMPDLPLDAGEADRAAAIFDRLRLPDVPGQPRLGDAGAEWFREIVRALFGSLDRETGERRVPGVFLLVPKKNSKTTNGAALMLVAMLMNRRPRAQFGLFGPTQEVAQLAFQAAAGMVDADPDLRKLFHVQPHLKQITMRTGWGKGSTLKITTFDPSVATGGKYAGWLLDEAHLLGRVAHAQKVIGDLRGARTAIPEQFGMIISTQSAEPPAGAFKTELQYARDVRDGRVENATVLPVLYEFPEAVQRGADKAWRDPRVWGQVLPNLGRSVSLGVLISDYRTASAKGVEELARWASQHLNIQIGLGLHTDRWVGADYWPKAAEPMTLEELMRRSEVCVAGIDGGGLDDLMGLAVIGRCAETKRWLGWVHAWAQPAVLERRKEIAPMLADFAAQGDLTICAEATQDVVEVADTIERLLDAGLLPEAAAVGLDPYGVGSLVDEIDARGLTEAQRVAVRQGAALSPATWTLERKMADGTFRHAGQPLMSWCVSNARTEQRGNAVLITKQIAGKAKIDPVVALLNAAMLMSRNPVAGAQSYLETDALMVL